MSNNQPSSLNRYGILAASLSMFVLAFVVLIFRSHDLGTPGIIIGVLLIVFAAFLLFVYLSSNHKQKSI